MLWRLDSTLATSKSLNSFPEMSSDLDGSRVWPTAPPFAGAALRSCLKSRLTRLFASGPDSDSTSEL